MALLAFSGAGKGLTAYLGTQCQGVGTVDVS